MYSSMTAMIRLPERWQVVNALSGEKAFPGDVRQRTDESVPIRTNERNDGHGESSNRLPIAAYARPSLVAHNMSRGGDNVAEGAIRSTSGFGTGSLAVRATADSMADERLVLLVAYTTLVTVELQASRRGVNGPEH